MNREILDVCCGGRMFWFDKADNRSIFLDKRVESYVLNDSSKKTGKRDLVVRPDIQADFTYLPFPTDHFKMVVFDPPHFNRLGKTSWLRAKYGGLDGDWPTMLKEGFSECFRVLAPSGTLIFKWSSLQIPLKDILKLTPEKPLFGHKSGKQMMTHWVAFMKSTHDS